MHKPICIFLLLIIHFAPNAHAEDGYRLWLRYECIQNDTRLNEYRSAIQSILVRGESETICVIRDELGMGVSGLLGADIPFKNAIVNDGTLIVGTTTNQKDILNNAEIENLGAVGTEGFGIISKHIDEKRVILITANTDIGLLHGTFHFLQLVQTHQSLSDLAIVSTPKIRYRLLNHWDNLDRTVERGYAGFSLWQWHTLPDYIDPRYKDYARANASIGINGTVLTNVNSNAQILTPEYLEKVAALANVFRPYGIKVYLTARFSSPAEIGGLGTADPLNRDVISWWNAKCKEIYSYIPDFGGFLVKANSEGQPGPQDYGRSHAEGANLLAHALQPFGGIVMWRAFVYSNEEPEDRAKQAYNEFKPLDGKFGSNVMVQVKNGAIDFQPREPFHPMFGAMTETPLMMEFQITQEYLGQGIHLTYLAPLYKECLAADTYAKGKQSYVAKVIDGSLYNTQFTGMAGVSNIGNDRNWCGNPIAQSNWYALGKLAWDPNATSATIAEDWIRMTYSNDPGVIEAMLEIMMDSREAGVKYRTPLGLHHQMAWHHHYGPGPWIKNKPRADWTSVYYNKADENGIGFDRTASGSNAVSQYFDPVAEMFGNIETCPEEFLLWFHHVPWNYKMQSGNSLWDELCYTYYEGVEQVKTMQQKWETLKNKIDEERFSHVRSLFGIQLRDAIEWRDACVLYFQTFSKMPIPSALEKPEHSLDYYLQIDRKYLPGS